MKSEEGRGFERSGEMTFNKFISKKVCTVKNTDITVADIGAFAAVSLLAAIARRALIDIQSGDFNQFLMPWLEQIRAGGGLASLRFEIGNYTTPYMLFLTILSYFQGAELEGIKLFSVIFDYAAAVTVFLIVFKLTQNLTKSFISYTAVLLSPIVILNSAMWAQCDVIYSAFALLSLFAFIKKRPLLGCVLFGIAFSFKLQAVFFAPFIIYLWVMGKIKLKHMLTIPIVYFISIIPAWIAGRPLGDLLSIYFNQAGEYTKRLTYNYPNIYLFFSSEYAGELRAWGTILTIGIIGVTIYAMYKFNLNPEGENAIKIALCFAVIIPFLLPSMHERYGFLAELLIIPYVMLAPKKRIATGALYLIVSLCAYGPFLFGNHELPMIYASIINLGCIVLIVKDLFFGEAEPKPAEIKKQ